MKITAQNLLPYKITNLVYYILHKKQFQSSFTLYCLSQNKKQAMSVPDLVSHYISQIRHVLELSTYQLYCCGKLLYSGKRFKICTSTVHVINFEPHFQTNQIYIYQNF